LKRLIKKAFGKALYHGTNFESFLSIVQSGGIYPQETTASDWSKPENIDRYFDGDKEEYQRMMDNYEGYTFFATEESTAKWYGNRAEGKSNVRGVYIVLKVDVSEDALMPDLNDAPEAKTWQDSEKSVAQVSVLGTVTSDYIVGVTFVFTNIHIEVNTTIANWKNDVKKALSKESRSGYLDISDLIDLWDKLGIEHNLGSKEDW
jgi:hypothetical protein